MYIYIYTHVHVCGCVYIYIYEFTGVSQSWGPLQIADFILISLQQGVPYCEKPLHMYICAAKVNAVKHSTTTPPKRAEPFCNKNGVSPDKITDSIRVLGYSFAGARKADAHESQQLHQATMKAEKCKCFPGGLARRIRIAAAVVAPKMIAGWLFRFPSLENVKPLNAATRTLLRMAQQSDPSLFRIRQGHRHFHSKEAMPRMLRESWRVVLRHAAAACKMGPVLGASHRRINWSRSEPSCYCRMAQGKLESEPFHIVASLPTAHIGCTSRGNADALISSLREGDCFDILQKRLHSLDTKILDWLAQCRERIPNQRRPRSE